MEPTTLTAARMVDQALIAAKTAVEDNTVAQMELTINSAVQMVQIIKNVQCQDLNHHHHQNLCA
jgi:hypothetical protein